MKGSTVILLYASGDAMQPFAQEIRRILRISSSIFEKNENFVSFEIGTFLVCLQSIFLRKLNFFAQ